MTDIDKLKKLRRYVLVKRRIWDLNFMESLIQLDLEDIDFLMTKEINKNLIEISRSAIRKEKERI